MNRKHPAYVRDSAGKKAYVRAAVTAESELVDRTPEWDWYIDVRTGKYYVVAGR